MPRKRLPGPELPPGVRAVKAKGKTYYYYQRGRGTEQEGPRISLGADPFHPDFAKKLLEAQGKTNEVAAEKAHPKSVSALIAAYKASPEWAAHSESTKRSYAHYLGHLESLWGNLRADQVTPAGVLAYRDKHSPRSAKTMLSVGRTAFKWGIPRGFLTINPFQDVSPVKVEDRGHWPWPAWAVDFVQRHAPPDIGRFVYLAVETGQREVDVLRMRFEFIDGKGIWTTPQKTKRRYKTLFIPLRDEAYSEIVSYPVDPLFFEGGRWGKTICVPTTTIFLLSPTAKPYTPAGFRARWNRWLKTSPGQELMRRWGEYIDRNLVLFAGELDEDERKKPTLHGLRATAVVLRRMAGYQPQQISNDIGMSMPMVLRYTRFMDQREAAENNIVLLNEHMARRKKPGASPVDRATGNN